jgi:hypothetical protein
MSANNTNDVSIGDVYLNTLYGEVRTIFRADIHGWYDVLYTSAGLKGINKECISTIKNYILTGEWVKLR